MIGTKMQRDKVTEGKEKMAVSALCLCYFVPFACASVVKPRMFYEDGR